MDTSIISIIILFAAMIFYVFGILPIPIVAMCSAAAMVLFGVIDAQTAWAAFASDNVLVMAGACVVGSSMFITGAADKIADSIIKLAGGKAKLSILLMLLIAGTLSSVMSNTVCTIMFLPLILGVVSKARDEGVYEQIYMQMLTIVTSVGGLITLVGSPVNILGSALSETYGLGGFGMFQMAPIAIICFAVILIYTFVIGPVYGKKIFGENPEPCDFVKDFIKSSNESTEKITSMSEIEAKEAHRKQITSTLIMIATVIGLLTKDLHGISIGTVAVCGGLLCVITKCISAKEMYTKIEIETLLMLAGTIGCAAGLSNSGGGELIAKTLLGLFNNVTPTVLYVVIVGISAILTQFMSNTATVSIMIPIGVPMAVAAGVNPMSVVVGITVLSSMSFATPMASPTQVLVMNWGSYEFIDYVKYSGPITFILDILCIILIPLFYPLV